MHKAFIQDFSVVPNGNGHDALRELQKRTSLKPDVLILSSSHPEPYGFWSRASAFARDAHFENLFAFDVKHGCNGGNLSLKMGKDFLRDSNCHQVLIIVDDQLSQYVDLNDKELEPFHAWGNSGTAILLTKDAGLWEVLEFTSVTDVRFADNVRLHPGNDFITLETDEETESEIGRIYRENYLRVITQSLKLSQVQAANGLCMNQGDWKLRNYIQRETMIPQIQDTFKSHGHLGGSDIFIGLQHLGSEIKEGEHVVLASSALGYSWSGQVLRKCLC